MNRQDMIFDITYSYYLESLFSQFISRLDKWTSFFLIILGSSVLVSFSNPIFVALSIIVLSTLQLVFQFGKNAGLSEVHSKKYLNLMTIESTLTDDELLKQFTKLQTYDTKPWRIFSNIAFSYAAKKLGLKDDTKLTRIEKFLAFLAG